MAGPSIGATIRWAVPPTSLREALRAGMENRAPLEGPGWTLRSCLWQAVLPSVGCQDRPIRCQFPNGLPSRIFGVRS
jgi:hypothetical protein